MEEKKSPSKKKVSARAKESTKSFVTIPKDDSLKDLKDM